MIKTVSGTKTDLPISAAPDDARNGGEIVLAGVQYPPRRNLSQLIEHESTRRRTRRIYIWSAMVTVAVMAAAVAYWLQPVPVPFAERFRVQPVAMGDIVREVLATGNVAAVTTVQVGAEISGRIAIVEVDYNSPVKAGQVMARFDKSALEAQLEQAQGALGAANAQLDQAKTDSEHASTDLQRSERLHASRAISDADYEGAVANARQAEQRVAGARAQLATQQAQARLARTNLGHATIVAPIAGIVITRNIDPGQTVASALQTPVLFTVAQNLKKMRVIAAVDEADIGEVIKGQHATFTVDAYPNRKFDGVVTEVRNSPVVVQDVVTYGTVVEVENTDLALKPGMTASVRIRTAEATNVQKIPAEALTFIPPGETVESSPGVWILSGNSLRRVGVRPGVSDGESTEIAPDALKLSDRIIVDLTPQGRKAYGAGD